MVKQILNDRLDWNLLRTFMVVAEEGNFSRAAARLHLTQSAISQSVKRLEEQLGCILLLRRGPRFDVTQTGTEILNMTREIYGQVSRIGAVAELIHNDISGTVRILIATKVQSDLFDSTLARFHANHPGVQFEIEVMRSSDIISNLLQKTATLGLGICRLPVAKIKRHCLLNQRYAFYCGRSHKFFGIDDVSLNSMAGENFVSFTSDQVGDSLSPLTFFRDKSGLTGKIVASSSSFEEVIRLIYAGFGIGCLPEHVAEQEVKQGKLWKLPPIEGVADVDINLLWNHEQKMSLAEGAFLSSLLHELAKYDLT